MADRPSGQYGRSAGVDLAAALAFAGLLIFRTEDAVSHVPPGVSPDHVSYLLKALTDAGWLVRLRRGLYAGTERLPGGVDIPPFVPASALVSPSAIGLWSALAHHDLTDQVPVVVTAITPRKVITPSMRTGQKPGGAHAWRVAGFECRFVTLSERRYKIGSGLFSTRSPCPVVSAASARVSRCSTGLSTRWIWRSSSTMRCSTARGRWSSVWAGALHGLEPTCQCSCPCSRYPHRRTASSTRGGRAAASTTRAGSSSSTSARQVGVAERLRPLRGRLWRTQ